jgi:hypothetical protein
MERPSRLKQLNNYTDLLRRRKKTTAPRLSPDPRFLAGDLLRIAAGWTEPTAPDLGLRRIERVYNLPAADLHA